ncbi:ABC transporter ATP-binding protein [Sinanaerobacter chloroacetimidivorans]|uniref:ATP-binding cassette domain-containing protein n=1 Tax=Sinanaerobacter chloroacetimidivorans TaxID=2818044 RepID=A0A8J8B165_9FIRM|nr:ATP-binding cassette domain-containing protein [Sinanaerobacter chloroacetimidivorans]MBR0598373.1 ATP-binding cassette domain-containing protein [Sinanaerobacter chloroacetimidivorans]
MIEVKNLTKYYGKKMALDRVSFSVKDGEVLGLLGLNGAGKSTTMNILTGYIGATEGTVTVNGYDIMLEPMKAKSTIGYLPEQPPLYLDMKVREYLEFVCSLKKVRNKDVHIEEICRQVGITAVSNRLIKNLSKGYKQRVGLAQALAGNPKVLILDEPTAGLDPSQIIEIRTLIKELGKERTIIVSSHILPEIKEMCSRVVVLHQGKLIADDTPENLSRTITSPHQVTAWIKGSSEAVIQAVSAMAVPCHVKLLAEKETDVYEYELTGPEDQDIREAVFRTFAKADLPILSMKGNDFTLEEIFLKLIHQSPEKGGGKDAGNIRPGN